ncbi:MAG: SRPBCC family protein [Terriglobales bacterium]
MAFTLEYSTVAKCKPEHVWKFFSNMEQWSWWNRVLGNCYWLNGQPWQKGSRFHMELLKPRNMKFEPEILECTPPHKVGWVGRKPGFVGEHWFSFEEQPDGTTVMKQWENFSGIGTLFFGDGSRKKIVDMYAAWFEALKFEAERLAREEKARS